MKRINDVPEAWVIGSAVLVRKYEGEPVRYERVESIQRGEVVTSHVEGPFIAMHFWWAETGRGKGDWSEYYIEAPA